MFSSKKLLELLLFLNVNSSYVVKSLGETHEILFFSDAFRIIFGKVRELVGEIEYAFDGQWAFCLQEQLSLTTT